MVDRGRSGVKRRKDVYTKEWSIKDGNYLVISWCTSSRTQRKAEDNRVGDTKLLVARDNKRCGKRCGRMWYMPKDEE